ncbi:MAG: carbohydrate-binding domain-containing protein, partial [Candidatus Promineifilaceae bacterium]|nr:carbohydrate-binding domain-containing protein [Candidatus Promineifilaceae bacterium]
MIKKAIVWAATAALMILLITSCGAQPDSTVVSETEAAATISSAEPAQNSVTETAAEIAAVNNINLDTDITSVPEAAGENSTNLQDVEDYSWTSSDVPVVDSSAVSELLLDGDSISVSGEGVTVDGRTATITSAGTYALSGSLDEGQIVVDTEDAETVQLVLNGIKITNTSTAPIFIANAALTEIVLPANSENYVADGAEYIFADPEEDEPNAAIFSKDELVIDGAGSLTIEANYNDGIASKDGLVIAGGNLVVDAVDDGIRGKDYLIITDGSILVTAQGDGLKSDEDQDTTKGYISIEGGLIDITSGGDAIQAATDVLISAGEFVITSGSGISTVDAESSAKGIKGTVNVIIDGGSFTINSADDAIHSNDNITINGGTFAITTGDDGLHADATLELNGGLLDISDSYEGIESAVITINDGEIYIVSTDDGLNVAGGNDGSGFG